MTSLQFISLLLTIHLAAHSAAAKTNTNFMMVCVYAVVATFVALLVP